MVLALDRLLHRTRRSGTVASNLLDFLYFNSDLCQGPRGNPAHPAFGLVGWAAPRPHGGSPITATTMRASCWQPCSRELRCAPSLGRAAAAALLANLRTAGRSVSAVTASTSPRWNSTAGALSRRGHSQLLTALRGLQLGVLLWPIARRSPRVPRQSEDWPSQNDGSTPLKCVGTTTWSGRTCCRVWLGWCGWMTRRFIANGCADRGRSHAIQHPCGALPERFRGSTGATSKSRRRTRRTAPRRRRLFRRMATRRAINFTSAALSCSACTKPRRAQRPSRPEGRGQAGRVSV